MRFCIHLVHQGSISHGQFVTAMEEHLKGRKPLGRLAMESGLISMRQTFEILERQTETGLRFGHIAVKLGYLTEPQLTELLSRQSAQNQSVADILLAAGAISNEGMAAEFQRYCREQPEKMDLQESCICGSACKYLKCLEPADKKKIPVLSA
jgi:hypothetical protein